MCTMWVLGVCTDHDHHHINWALPVRVDAAEDFLKLIKGGARGGQIGPAAMDHLSVGRQSLHSVQVDVRDMQTPKKTHHSQSISCCTQHQSISYIWFQITRLQAIVGYVLRIQKLDSCLWTVCCWTFDGATTYVKILMWAWAVILTEVREVDFWLPVYI